MILELQDSKYMGMSLKSERQTFWDGFCTFLWADWIPDSGKFGVPLTLRLSEKERQKLPEVYLVGSPHLASGSGWVALILSNCHARVWRNRKVGSERKGRKRLWDEQSGMRKGASAHEWLEKEWLGDRGMGQKKVYRKMVRLSVCASDFNSQRKKYGELFEGLILANIVNAIWWKKKNSNVSQNQGLGLQMLIVLSLSVYTSPR